jgi:hypothetical protein
MTDWSRPDVRIVWGAGSSIHAGTEPYSSWKSSATSDQFPILHELWTDWFPWLHLEDIVDAALLANEIGPPACRLFHILHVHSIEEQNQEIR